MVLNGRQQGSRRQARESFASTESPMLGMRRCAIGGVLLERERPLAQIIEPGRATISIASRRNPSNALLSRCTFRRPGSSLICLSARSRCELLVHHAAEKNTTIDDRSRHAAGCDCNCFSECRPRSRRSPMATCFFFERTDHLAALGDDQPSAASSHHTTTGAVPTHITSSRDQAADDGCAYNNTSSDVQNSDSIARAASASLTRAATAGVALDSFVRCQWVAHPQRSARAFNACRPPAIDSGGRRQGKVRTVHTSEPRNHGRGHAV
jgi:hypothetical protein